MKTDQYINGTYLEKVKDWHIGDAAWKTEYIYNMMTKHELYPASIYDIGCGAGEVLVQLQKKMSTDVEFCGFDISPQAISISKPKENHRLKFHNKDFLTAKTSFPDLVLLLDVFEHIPDYLGFLTVLRKKARWFIFHIPIDISALVVLKKSEWMLYMRERYGHLHYFTKESALATLAETGYEVIDYAYTDDEEINGKPPSGIKPRIVYEIRKNLYRLSPGFAVSLFRSFNMLVLARADHRSEN
jgi:SAM-dependent methyltransferase